MKVKNTRRTIAVVAAIFVVDLMVSGSDVRYMPSTLASLRLAQIVTQVALAAAWACLGPQRLIVRFLAGLAVAAAAFGQLHAWGPMAVEEFELALIVECVVIAGGLATAQLLGFRLIRQAADGVESDADASIPQFSISQMMFLTAAVAAVVAGLVRISNLAPGQRAVDTVGVIAGAYFAGVTLASLMAALTAEQPTVPVAAIGVGSVALGFSVALAMHNNGLIGPGMLLMGAISTVEALAFGVLRRRGYRFCRARAAVPLAPAASSD